MATIQRKGYGQVEPNHLSAQKTGQLYAQLPAATNSNGTLTATAQLEQGQFLKYDYAKGCADLTGLGEWLMVYNEEKLYDPRRQAHKDFVAKATDYSDGFIYPRLYRIELGDIFTTNTIGAANTTGPDAIVGTVALAVGEYCEVDTSTGFLKKAANATGTNLPIFEVAAVTTMPDGQVGVKLQRIK